MELPKGEEDLVSRGETSYEGCVIERLLVYTERWKMRIVFFESPVEKSGTHEKQKENKVYRSKEVIFGLSSYYKVVLFVYLRYLLVDSRGKKFSHYYRIVSD